MARIRFLRLFVYALVLLAPACVFSRELPDYSAKIVIKSGTAVKLQFTDTICSASAHARDSLNFRVAKDVIADGFTVIPAGSIARGRVTGVKPKRMLGIGGKVSVTLDSLQLPEGAIVDLVAQQKFKGRSHTIRMGIEMAIASAIYFPAAPVFLLSHGRDSTVLKGTELTAYTKSDVALDASNLRAAAPRNTEAEELVKLLPARALNGEGREGDMLNLILVAKEDDLQAAFSHAGWLAVEQSHPQIIWHLLLQRTHYAKLPMDHLYAFGRPQDYSFSMPDPAATVARRHHLRIWKTDRVMDDKTVWVAAATHDIGIQFVLRKLWLFHKIDPNVDAERDFIAESLTATEQLTKKQYIARASPLAGAETATGQAFYSDNRMLLMGFTTKATMAPREK